MALRLWLLALDRFEYRLRGPVAKARNAFIRSAAFDVALSGHVWNHSQAAHRKRLADTLDAHYRAVIPHFAGMALKQVKSRRVERKADLFAALVAEWVAREALRKASLIADTDRDDVTREIDKGIAGGLGTAEIARNIRRVSQLTPYRAATVARTETHAAATYGAAEAARDAEATLGVKLVKVWLPTLDDRTRPDHRAMDGRPGIPLGEKFDVGGVLMDRPGDPSAPPEQTINCRCAVAFEEATTD